jgi:hypothetical protein
VEALPTTATLIRPVTFKQILHKLQDLWDQAQAPGEKSA